MIYLGLSYVLVCLWMVLCQVNKEAPFYMFLILLLFSPITIFIIPLVLLDIKYNWIAKFAGSKSNNK